MDKRNKQPEAGKVNEKTVTLKEVKTTVKYEHSIKKNPKFSEQQLRIFCAKLSFVIEPADEIIGELIWQIGLEQLAVIVLSRENFSKNFAKLLSKHKLSPENQQKLQQKLLALNKYAHSLGLSIDSELPLEKWSKQSIGFITPFDRALWPDNLKCLGNIKPICLWYRGNIKALDNARLDRSLSVVGTRAPSEYGRSFTRRLCLRLAKRNWTLVSGGAYGIDSVAHLAFCDALNILRSQGLDHIKPTNIVVLAGGVDDFYPSGNANLFSRILNDGGVILSEFPPGTTPRGFRFLARNRLIAALGRVSVITEAPFRSGAISTANHAFKLLKSVYALPGPIDSPNSTGTNNLIKQGIAMMITSSKDIACLDSQSIDERNYDVENYGGDNYTVQSQSSSGNNYDKPDFANCDFSPWTIQVYDSLFKNKGLNLEALIAKSQLNIDQVLTALGELEQRSFVKQKFDHWVKA